MPLTPDDSLEPAAQSLPPTETFPSKGSAHSHSVWRSRVVRICFMLFTFEIGVFLVIFPWTESWGFNYIQDLAPSIQGVWNDPYFRGAVSGLGFLNVYLSCLEVIFLFKRS
jgi:hypothetical protein